ncbi:adenine deaminase [Falsiroseomonas selenitidurans]|uniref:Adenine deaminase n=1 Tax=Falsiroseomonas selenitidurans TaxID=2716335 RepID=A0ABX1E151_9PROT|nr:adenine deaminase C-terminal domain-containing protein [Falsiroseomonas selenitidurans]NKC30887.1 adenine deaminase [Falsiroseomonas selenitidurans]
MTQPVDQALRARAVQAARGAAPFDLLLTGGTVVDVATGELRAADVGIVGPLIASVHPPGLRADAASVEDATGRFVAPGFIDSHLHYESSLMAPADYAGVVVPAGTTTCVWDPHELANVLGVAGVRWAVEASRHLPLRTLVAAPSCVPSAPGLELAGAEIGPAEMAEMLAWPEVVGVAEVMDMPGVLRGTPHMTGIVGAGLAAGKNVNGHARGLLDADLQAYATAGVTSDHEITAAEDFLQKLRAGLTVELRGSHDQVLPGAVAALATLPLLPVNLVLATDDVFPDELVAKGGLRDTIARVIARGLSPISAIRLATLHAAMRLKRDDLGLVAPGRRADLVLLSDLALVAVDRVLVDGVVVAKGGALVVPPARRTDAPTDTMKLPPQPPEAFALRVAGLRHGRARLRRIIGARFTAWGEAEVTVRDGVAAVPPGHTVLTIIHRHGRAPAVPRTCLTEGWGTMRGAIATTIAHDSHNLLVLGDTPDNMAAAANAVIAAGGGMAVAEDGAVTALLPLPIAGLIATTPAGQTAENFARLREAAGRVCDWQPPYRIFRGITGISLACNAGPHLTDLGLTDGATGDIFDPAEPLPA